MRQHQEYQENRLFSEKDCMIELVSVICSYKMYKNDTQPMYLQKYFEFCMQNLHQYEDQVNE
jgi:hypothetical protein